MKERTKVSAFFCENCGKPVPLAAKVCPHCGRRFDAVKCPRCDFLGKPELFVDGCPSCGYAKGAEGGPPEGRMDAEVGGPKPAATPLQRAKPVSKKQRAARPARPIRVQPPRWAYMAFAVILFIVLVVLIYVIFRTVLTREI